MLYSKELTLLSTSSFDGTGFPHSYHLDENLNFQHQKRIQIQLALKVSFVPGPCNCEGLNIQSETEFEVM